MVFETIKQGQVTCHNCCAMCTFLNVFVLQEHSSSALSPLVFGKKEMDTDLNLEVCIPFLPSAFGIGFSNSEVQESCINQIRVPSYIIFIKVNLSLCLIN